MVLSVGIITLCFFRDKEWSTRGGTTNMDSVELDQMLIWHSHRLPFVNLKKLIAQILCRLIVGQTTQHSLIMLEEYLLLEIISMDNWDWGDIKMCSSHQL